MRDRSVELKTLQTRLRKAEAILEALRDEQRGVSRRMTEAQATVDLLRRHIAALQNAGVVITEHAMLRYLQRVHGIDLEQVQREMLPANVEERIRTLGSGLFPVDGFSLRVRDGQVVTVVAPAEGQVSTNA